MVWMRVSHPREDELNEIRCEPSFYHMYYVPELHNIAPKIPMNVKPVRNKDVYCDGMTIGVHWVKGYTNSRHVRVALALQIGKDIVIQDNGHMCFYATRGINSYIGKKVENGMLKAISSTGKETRSQLGNIPLSQSGHLPGQDPEKTIAYNEQRTWYKDFYNLYWDLDLKENIYLIVQYIERKPENINPTITAVITRKLIEDEYDLVGYTVFQINNKDGTLRYGNYVLDLYDGPIFIEELDVFNRTEYQIKLSLGKPGDTLVNNLPVKTPQTVGGQPSIQTPS